MKDLCQKWKVKTIFFEAPETVSRLDLTGPDPIFYDRSTPLDGDWQPTVLHVCELRRLVVVFSEHGACLFTTDEDGLQVLRAVIQQCTVQSLPEPGRCP